MNVDDINLIENIGFSDLESIFVSCQYKTNKFNRIIRLNSYQIRKTGVDLSGEVYYYSIIKRHPCIQKYFPKFYKQDDKNSIIIEYINGTSISKIYYEGLFSVKLIEKLLNTVYDFHKIQIDDGVYISHLNMYEHYMNKFEERSRNTKDYPFEDFKQVYDKVKENLIEFLYHKHPINQIIHGDLWFSNMMYYKQQFYFYDMRGKINKIPTIKGHVLYDYGKIYQSIIGLDAIIIYNTHMDSNIRQSTEKAFWELLYKNKVITNEEEKKTLIHLTGYLLYNTFFAYDDAFELSKKQKIWELVKECSYA